MAEFKLIIGNKNYSSWSLRGWLALKKTGVDFEEILIPLHKPDTKEKIRAQSPSGWVPVLHGPDGPVWDSLAIAEYLADRFPAAGLWPADPAARAVARSIAAEMHSGFPALRRNYPMNMRATLPARPENPEAEADIARIEEIWTDCRRNFGAGGPFLFGDFTAADAFYAPVVSRFATYGVAMGPVAEAYAEAVRDWPDMREWTDAAAAEPWVIEAYEV